ncbi:hypothetical protein EOD10_20355 [Mesorhizobium sp. M7A.T.Ca.TU.009.01.3.2]|nr:hypothetical protein EOD10_20355 [Mesorhizobium sp. M7A.T.Ca.TU.009.01.3.2]
MMPGVAAQPLGGRSVFSPTVLADADYIGGIYEIAGLPVAAADIIDKPARIGASGLEILDNDIDGVVSPIDDYLSLWLTLNWTVRIEWQELTTDGATYLLWMQEPEDGHSFLIERSTAFTGLRVDAHEASNITRDVPINTSHGPGIHTIVVTRTDDRLSISCDGSAVVTVLATPTMNPLTTVSFGGDLEESFNGCFIRKVTLYAPLDDIWLPSLSA